MLKMSRKFAATRPDGYNEVRVSHRSPVGKTDPRHLFKCGCCDNSFEVYYGGDSLEIAGVMGSVANWRELLLPLLDMKQPGQTPGKQRDTRKLRRNKAAESVGA